MKPKLTNLVPTMVLLPPMVGLILISAMAASAADDAKKAATARGLPTPTAVNPLSPPPPPLASTAVTVRDWKEPDQVLPEVTCDGLPLGLVADQLRKEFHEAFDVLLPSTWHDSDYPSMSFEPQNLTITMKLKNVTASQVFNAMNLVFQVENTPVHWELTMNGTRSVAVLRVLPERFPAASLPQRATEVTRMVYFVGDLVGDDKSGTTTMDQLVKTVSEIFEMSYGPSKGVLQFHNGAQLLIVTGTGDQVRFMEQTLSALRDRSRAQVKPQVIPSYPKPLPEAPKAQ